MDNTELIKYALSKMTPKERQFVMDMREQFGVDRVMLGRKATSEVIVWNRVDTTADKG